MKKRLFFALMLLSLGELAAQTVTNSIYNVSPGNGLGIRFWSNANYSITMGNTSNYKFGPVTDYSIRTNMSNTAGRGWTWAPYGKAPVAAIGVNGKMQLRSGLTLLSDWVRVVGAGGIFFQSHGGGFRMVDKTWIRTYGGKSFYHDKGVMRTDGTFQVGNGGSRMLVKGGRVGINQKAPAGRLHVTSGSNEQGLLITSPYGNSHFPYSNGFTYISGKGVVFRTGSTERFRLNANGYIGIAKTNPAYHLDVNGTINAKKILVNGQPLGGGSTSGNLSRIDLGSKIDIVPSEETSGTFYRRITSISSDGTTVLALKPKYIATDKPQNSNLELYDDGGNRFVIGHNSKYDYLNFSYKSKSGTSPGSSLRIRKNGIVESKSFRFEQGSNNHLMTGFHESSVIYKMGVEDGTNHFNVFQINTNTKAVGLGGNEDSKTFVYGKLILRNNPEGTDFATAQTTSTSDLASQQEDAHNWYGRADYVFSKEYKLKPIEDVETFIKANKHLPGVKSASDIVRDGYHVMEEGNVMLEKIEELTLYTIEQQKQLKRQAKLIDELISRIDKLEK